MPTDGPLWPGDGATGNGPLGPGGGVPGNGPRVAGGREGPGSADSTPGGREGHGSAGPVPGGPRDPAGGVGSVPGGPPDPAGGVGPVSPVPSGPRDPAGPVGPVPTVTEPRAATQPGGSAGQHPAALLHGPGHVIVYANVAFAAAFGAECVGLPAIEALLDLPAAAFAVFDIAYREGRAVACAVPVRGREHRLVAAPRRVLGSSDVYGVALHLVPTGA